MPYRVQMLKSAAKELAALPAKDRERLRTAIDRLQHSPREYGIIKLTDREEYRLRSGDFRVIFAIDDAVLLVTVRSVANRRDAY